MKIKYANRPDWKRIIKKTYKCIFIEEQDFRGYIAYLSLDKVKEPLWVTHDHRQVCIVDQGYVWLQLFPIHGNHVLTATFNKEGILIYCYFDVVRSVGTTDTGVPYLEDLYIDVVALPNGEVFLKDEDELEDAYQNKEITIDEFELAKEEANRLVQSLRQGKSIEMKRYYHMMKEVVTSD